MQVFVVLCRERNVGSTIHGVYQNYIDATAEACSKDREPDKPSDIYYHVVTYTVQ